MTTLSRKRVKNQSGKARDAVRSIFSDMLFLLYRVLLLREPTRFLAPSRARGVPERDWLAGGNVQGAVYKGQKMFREGCLPGVSRLGRSYRMVGAVRSNLPLGTKVPGVDVVFLHPQTHEALRNAEGAGGSCLVSPGGLQGIDDHLLFHARQCGRQVFVCRITT